MLSWEISSGRPPFDDSYDVNLAIQIVQNLRETIIPGTPTDYSNLYTGKYNFEFNFNLLSEYRKAFICDNLNL